MMDWSEIEENWLKVKGKIKEMWSLLTDDDLDYIEGRRDFLVAKLMERYGIAREEAERLVEKAAKSDIAF
jgi:uncharacterized protein YjbJ (UPF0337 family)